VIPSDTVSNNNGTILALFWMHYLYRNYTNRLSNARLFLLSAMTKVKSLHMQV
jgi:hypothetical protein